MILVAHRHAGQKLRGNVNRFRPLVRPALQQQGNPQLRRFYHLRFQIQLRINVRKTDGNGQRVRPRRKTNPGIPGKHVHPFHVVNSPRNGISPVRKVKSKRIRRNQPGIIHAVQINGIRAISHGRPNHIRHHFRFEPGPRANIHRFRLGSGYGGHQVLPKRFCDRPHKRLHLIRKLHPAFPLLVGQTGRPGITVQRHGNGAGLQIAFIPVFRVFQRLPGSVNQFHLDGIAVRLELAGDIQRKPAD